MNTTETAMNDKATEAASRRWVNLAAVLTALATMAVLAGLMIHYTRPPDLNAQRAAERAAALVELTAQNQEALNTYGWADQPRQIVRLPVARAMELMVGEWADPAAGRARLKQRLDKATAKAPPPVNPYE